VDNLWKTQWGFEPDPKEIEAPILEPEEPEEEPPQTIVQDEDDEEVQLCPLCIQAKKKNPQKVFCAGLCQSHYKHLREREKQNWDGERIPRARDFHVWPIKKIGYGHQFEWLDIMQDQPWCLMMAPCDHGKTDTVAISYALFRVAENPDIRIAIIGATAPLAKITLNAIKTHLEFNYDYIRYFEKLHGFKPKPDRPRMWTKEAACINRHSEDSAIKDPTLIAVGKGCEIENRRIDLIIGDDMITKNAAASDVQRETDKQWFLDVVMTRGEEDCEVKLIGTPEHPDDLYEWIATGETETGEKVNEFFYVVRVRAVAPKGESHYYTDTENIVTETEHKDEELHALCPEMMSLPGLLKRSKLSFSTFMRKYQCRHSAETERMFPPGKVNACKDIDVIVPASYDRYDRDFRMTVMGIDIATGHGISFFAMALLGIDMDFRHVLLNVFRARLRFAKQLEQIMKWYRAYVPSYVGVESNGQQNAIIDAYKNVRVVEGVDVTGIERVPFEAVFTSKDLILGTTTGLSAMVDNGNLIIPDGNIESTNTFLALVQEMKGYPSKQLKDCLMALLIAEGLYVRKCTVGDNVGSVPNVPIVRGAFRRRVKGARATRFRKAYHAPEGPKRDEFGLPKGGGVKVSLLDEIRKRSFNGRMN